MILTEDMGHGKCRHSELGRSYQFYYAYQDKKEAVKDQTSNVRPQLLLPYY